MLISALDEVKRSGGEYRTLKLYGQERNLITSSIARMNLFLHGVEDFEIIRGDTLAEPKHIEGDRLRQFDVILANPPYSIKQWNREAWSSDKWGRNSLGTPPQGRADYAFQQHILTSLTAKGRSAVLWPHGVLFRNEEQAMRAKMVEQDWVEAVIGLGPNLFYNSPMESCIVICNRKKAAARKGKVIFIDAVNEVTRERAQSFLKPEHQQRILSAYKTFADVPGFAKVATLAEIGANAGNLSIPLYVKRIAAAIATDSNGDAVSLRSAWDQWQTDGRAFWQQMDAAGGNAGWTDHGGRRACLITTSLKPAGRSGVSIKWRRTSMPASTTRPSPDGALRWPRTPRWRLVSRFVAGVLRIDVEATKLMFKKGDIIFGRRRAYQRKLGVAEFDGICSAHAMVLRAKPDVVLSEAPCHSSCRVICS